MVELPDPWVLWALFLLAIAVFVLFAYNAQESWQEWREHRNADSFRAFLMAFLLALGLFTIVLTRMAGVFFVDDERMRDVLRFAGAVMSGAILTVGIGLAVSRRRHP